MVKAVYQSESLVEELLSKFGVRFDRVNVFAQTFQQFSGLIARGRGVIVLGVKERTSNKQNGYDSLHSGYLLSDVCTYINAKKHPAKDQL
jgi:hypothetical protein